MIISVSTISVIGMWMAQIFYVLCYIPQIMFNYKNKMGRGLSDLMLLGYFNCLVAVLYYVFLCNLPLAYKLLPPLQLVAIVILIFQRLFYDNARSEKSYWFVYSGNMFGVLLFIPLALHNPMAVGWYAGWLMFIFGCLCQLPQVYKIFREKSVSTFSCMFAIFTPIASLIEFATSWVIRLPVQTLITAFRGVIISIIWLIQFRIYRKN